MVGVPRSSGCRICVQRRVRCDGARPICNNCRKGNRPCPGYGPGVKFQDEGPRLREKYQKGQETSSATDSDSDSSIFALTPSSVDSASPKQWNIIGLDVDGSPVPGGLNMYRFVEGKTNIYQSADLPGDSSSRVLHFLEMFTIPILSPEAQQIQLLSNFTQAITPPEAKVLPKIMRGQGTWLSQVADFSGASLVLDSAIRAVTLVHLGRIQKNETFVIESRPYYGKALRLLNGAITDKVMGMDNKTLCATILLSFYEMFASDSDAMWVRHAGGAGALMRIRGPKRHRYGFDRDIFVAYRFTLVIEALTNDVPSFLAEPEWVQLSRDIYADIIDTGQISPQRRPIFDIVEDFHHEMAMVSATCAKASHIILNIEKFGFSDDHNVSSLTDQLNDHHTILTTLYRRWKECLRRINQAPPLEPSDDPVIPYQYRFSNTFIASMEVGFGSMLMLINCTLIPLSNLLGIDVEQLTTENEQYAMQACYSVDFMLKSSFLGPFFIIYALRYVFRIFPHGDIRADWALCKLIEIGDKRMQFAKAPIGGGYLGAWERPEIYYDDAQKRLEEYNLMHRPQIETTSPT